MSSRRPIPTSIDSAYHAINEHVARRLRQAGYAAIRPSHAKVFEQIGEGSRVTAMAEGAQITKQSMGELVAHLEAHGYVERVPDPADRRAKIVRLTRKGHACAREAWRGLGDLSKDWARQLGPNRLETLGALLDELVDAMPPTHPPDA